LSLEAAHGSSNQKRSLVAAVRRPRGDSQVVHAGLATTAIRAVAHVGTREGPTTRTRGTGGREPVEVSTDSCSVEAVSLDGLGQEQIGSRMTAQAILHRSLLVPHIDVLVLEEVPEDAARLVGAPSRVEVDVPDVTTRAQLVRVRVDDVDESRRRGVEANQLV